MIAVLRLLLLVLGLGLAAAPALTPAPGLAQTAEAPGAPDFEQWESLAGRASDVIEKARASTAALEELRNQLVTWRDRFFAAQDINKNAIATAEAQLNALGPPPEDGSEAEGIAQQRTDLNERLAQLREPAKKAQLAHSRADGLIKGIDEIIRDRQTTALLERGPSPLNPKHWPEGLEALGSIYDVIHSEIVTGVTSDAQRAEFRKDLPLVILLVLVGLILLVRGRFWVELAVRLVLPQRATSGRWIITLLMSLGEVFVPFIGLMALTRAAHLSGMTGFRTDQFIDAAVWGALAFLIARWLALRCFPRSDMHRLPLALEAEDRRAGRLYGALLGVVIGLFSYFDQVSEIARWTDAARVVVLFPVMLVAGLLLIRMSRLLAKHTRGTGAEETQDTFRNRLTRLLSRALIALAVVAPLLAAVGYFKAASALMLPSLFSLLALAALLILHRTFTEIYILLTGNREGASEDLVPVLAGLFLVLLSSPIFALIWGARVVDLQELWLKFVNGITFGDMTLSPTIFLTLAVVFAIGYIATRLLQGTLKNTVLPKTRIDAGGRNAIVSGVGYIGIFLAALIAVTSAGIDLSSLAIVAGALSVGIGFGLQNIVSNFVSGIILLIERPISQGDWIEVNGQHGTVREISVRSTRIETFDRSDLIIPNSDFISGTVTNYTRGNTVGRVIVPVGVAYGTDTRKVESILSEVAKANPMVLLSPPPTVLFRGFGADSLDFEIRAILRDVNWVMNVHSDMNHDIAKRFAEEGIEIPFAQRDLWLRNPEVLDRTRADRPDNGTDDGADDGAAAEDTTDDAPEAQRLSDPDGPEGADK